MGSRVSVAPTTRYARSDGAHIAYHTLGDGPLDLLELPNGMYFSIEDTFDEPRWERFERALASFARVIRFDFRGIGMSDPFDPADPPSVGQWVRDGGQKYFLKSVTASDSVRMDRKRRPCRPIHKLKSFSRLTVWGGVGLPSQSSANVLANRRPGSTSASYRCNSHELHWCATAACDLLYFGDPAASLPSHARTDGNASTNASVKTAAKMRSKDISIYK
jgi:hypothetical protein